MTKLPVILVGDFNAAAGDDPAYDDASRRRQVRRFWTSAEKRGPAIGTFHNYAGQKKTVRGSIGSSRAARSKASGKRSRDVSRKRAYPSDHFPVRGDPSVDTPIRQDRQSQKWMNVQQVLAKRGAQSPHAKKKPPQVGQEPAEAEPLRASSQQ